MLEKLMKRREEEGFTLIELMVVVLIIAILLAIAIPTFLSARSRAQDRAAQSNLRNALTAAKSIFTDKQDYADASTSALQSSEPSLTFQATASSKPKEIDVDPGTSPSNTFIAAAKSDSGKCFVIKDVAATGGGTTYGTAASGTCDTSVAATATSW
jgi:type IV pilus assembly protein PilA